MTATNPSGGAAIPVSIDTTRRVQGGAAIPVYGYASVPTDGRPAQGGAALPVRVLTAADLKQNGGTWTLRGDIMAMPVYTAPASVTVQGGSAIPVYPINAWPPVAEDAPAVPLWQTAQDLFGSDIIAAWPLNETSGATAADAVDGHDAAYTNCTLNQEGPGVDKSVLLNGTNSLINLYSAGLNAAFTGTAFSMVVLAKIPAAAWVDGVNRVLFQFYATGNNYARVQKTSSDNQLQALYYGGGTGGTITLSDAYNPQWFMLALTVNQAENRVRMYVNDKQVGATLTPIGEWTGDLGDVQTALGAYFTETYVFSGNLSEGILFDRELTAAEVASLSPYALHGVTVVGDSKAAGSGDTPANNRQGWPAWMVDDMTTTTHAAIEMSRVAVGGADSAIMAARAAADAAALVAATATHPEDIIIALGVNDALAEPQPNQAAFEANMMTICNAYRAVCPSSRIWLSLCYSTTYAEYLASTINPGILHMIATTAWLRQGVDEATPLTGNLADGVHPTPAGYHALGAAYAALLA